MLLMWNFRVKFLEQQILIIRNNKWLRIYRIKCLSASDPTEQPIYRTDVPLDLMQKAEKWNLVGLKFHCEGPCSGKALCLNLEYEQIIPRHGKGKEVPLQARRGPEGSRTLRFPDFLTTAQVQDGGKVVSLTHRPPLPPGNITGSNFC
jgi:hypothetical protein